ncbi:SymE family type I addiction module toxin [Lachnospiraceae bacterium 54-53]
MQTKKMKVLYSSKSRSGSYLGSSTYITTPKISMEGKWLDSLGFHIGDAIEVSYEENCIRISPIPQQPAMVCEALPKYKTSKHKRAQ